MVKAGLWLGVVMTLCLCSVPGGPAFAQPSQTAQSIMLEIAHESDAYEIEGTLTWTYLRDTCAVPYYTNALVGTAADYTFQGCSGPKNNCDTYTGAPNQVCCAANAPSGAVIQAAVPAPGGGNNETFQHAQSKDERCAFFCTGDLSSRNYSKTATIGGANGSGNWTYLWNYTITPNPVSITQAHTCWSSEETGGTVDVGFGGIACSESFLKQSSGRSKYSFTLSSSSGSRVYNLTAVLQKKNTTTDEWENIQGYSKLFATDEVTGQLDYEAATEDFVYRGNAGRFGNAAVFASLHTDDVEDNPTGKPENWVSKILIGKKSDGVTAETPNADNFAGNDNDLAAGNVHIVTFEWTWEGLNDAGTYRTFVSGTLKGNDGKASVGFEATSNPVEVGGCDCGS